MHNGVQKLNKIEKRTRYGRNKQQRHALVDGERSFVKVEAMLGKFSLDTLVAYGGQSAGLFLILYLFTMIVLIMNFFVAILNDFLSATTP